MTGCKSINTVYEKPTCNPPFVGPLPEIANQLLLDCLNENQYQSLLLREIRLVNVLREQDAMLNVLCSKPSDD